jgi:ketosteroid isomerase-like protein
MQTETGGMRDEAEIRGLINDWVKAVRTKDINRILLHYAPEILSFDLAPPLAYEGREACRKNWEDWFATFQGPVGYEFIDLSIFAGGGVAFSHSLNRITGKRTSGEETDVWVRATVGYLWTNGNWMITHEHVSVPFYMDGSYRAAVDLKPDAKH